MKQFTDNAGRSWTVEVNVFTVKQCRDLAGVDLMDVINGDLTEKLFRDSILLCDVLYVLCKSEADNRGINDEEFGRAMYGDVLDSGMEALLDGIVSFCRNPRDRAVLGRVLKATNKGMEKARDLVETKLDSGMLDNAIDEAIRGMAEVETPGDSSTTAPESAASIPPP